MKRYSISSKTNSIGLVEGYTVTGTIHNEKNEVVMTVTKTGKVKAAVLMSVSQDLNFN